MQRLTLLRHAKSDWPRKAGIDDFDRTLSPRGRKDVPLMAKRWTKQHALPDLILASPAIRATMTARTFALGVGVEAAQLHFDMALYHASAATILQIAKTAAETSSAAHVMVVGHNPGLTELVNLLCDAQLDNLPTCAWASVDLSQAQPRLLQIASPKGSVDR